MRARVVTNPKSGTDRAPLLLPYVNARLRTVFDEIDITLTTSLDDAERAGASARSQGYDAVYVVGGDGTLNAVVRGMMREAGRTPVPIGVIPAGTGNDFAKALGLGEDAKTAVERLLEQRVIDVDVGSLNGRPFVNTSAGGFVAEVSSIVTEGLKDVTGKLAYLIGGARVLFGSEPFSATLTLAPGAAASGAGWRGAEPIQMFAVCNARFIGGGYPIAPDAFIDDGLLDVVVVPRMPLLDFVGVLQRIAAGDHVDDGSVHHFRAPAFDLAFDRRVRVNTDGEVLEAETCRYSVRPKALPFFCGRGAATLAMRP